MTAGPRACPCARYIPSVPKALVTKAIPLAPNSLGANPCFSWIGSLNLGPMWASEDYHDYYYSVAPAFATTSRPAYQARAGYSGFMGKISLKRNFGHYWLGRLFAQMY